MKKKKNEESNTIAEKNGGHGSQSSASQREFVSLFLLGRVEIGESFVSLIKRGSWHFWVSCHC